MQLTPVYGDDPLILLEGPPERVLDAVLRQRRRFAATLAGFDERDWRHPSRCEGWSVRDVVVHLDSTNAFWAFSVGAGLAGEPSRFLADFDPVANPAQLVADAPEVPDPELVERFRSSTEALAGALTSVEGDQWQRLAETPAGHVSIAALAHHALWDSWIHERDVLVPLGIDQPLLPDEVTACLRWVAALGPAFAVTCGTARPATLAVQAVGPECSFTVEVGERVTVAELDPSRRPGADLELRGDAVELVEALSVRAPLPVQPPPETAWLLTGLREVFDTAVP